MHQLFIIPGSCSTGIHILLNELNIDAKITERGDVSNYKELVPTNQVPALQVDDRILTEGANIALYLLMKHKPEMLDNPDFTQWLLFNYATLHPAYSKLFTINGIMEESQQKYELMQKLGDRVSELWMIVDQRLKQKQYMVGDEPSIVDYLLAVYLRWGNAFPDIQIPVGDNVLRLVEDVIKLPAVKHTLAKEQIEYQIPKSAYSK